MPKPTFIVECLLILPTDVINLENRIKKGIFNWLNLRPATTFNNTKNQFSSQRHIVKTFESCISHILGTKITFGRLFHISTTGAKGPICILHADLALFYSAKSVIYLFNSGEKVKLSKNGN